jgi:hypothetical protein
MARCHDKLLEFVWLIAYFPNSSLSNEIRMQTRDTRSVYANILGDGEDAEGGEFRLMD